MILDEHKKKKCCGFVEKLVLKTISLLIMIIAAPFIIGLMLIRGKHYHNPEMYSKP